MRSPKLQQTTIETYGKWLDKIAPTPFGSLKVGKIRSRDIRAWADSQALSDTNLARRLTWIHSLLKAAGNHEAYKPPAKIRHSRRPLTEAEELAILAHAGTLPDKQRLAVHLILRSGMRRCEVCALRHEDREADGIRLRRTVVRVKGELRVKPRGKNAQALSWIPLPDSLLAEIGPPRKGFILGATPDQPQNPDQLTDWIRAIAKAAGVRNVPHMGPHALRRTYGMSLIRAGADLITAAELMRHDAQTLAREYARSNPELKRKAVFDAFGETKPHPKPHEETA